MPGFICELIEYFKKYNPKIVENSSDPNFRYIYIKLTNHLYLFACYCLFEQDYDSVRIYKANTGYNIDELYEVCIKLKDDINFEFLNTAELNPIYDTNDIDFTCIDEYEYECELEKSEEDKFKSVYYYCDSIIKMFDDELYPHKWIEQDNFHKRFFHMCNYVSHLNILDNKYKDSNNIVTDIKITLYHYLQKKFNKLLLLYMLNNINDKLPVLIDFT